MLVITVEVAVGGLNEEHRERVRDGQAEVPAELRVVASGPALTGSASACKCCRCGCCCALVDCANMSATVRAGARLGESASSARRSHSKSSTLLWLRLRRPPPRYCEI